MHYNNYNLPKKILSWYDNNKRTLPWRISQKSKKKQYYRLLSEFMLQQTQVRTAIPYFKKFVKEIPNLKFLSKSKGKKVLKLWEGLGYYRRAKNLHKTSKILIKNYNGKLPKNFEEMIKLPGIGEYTANVLLALVYNYPHIPLDANVKRVFYRLFFVNQNSGYYNEKIFNNINKFFTTTENAKLAEALIEFGALVCKPINPLCKICKLQTCCKFYNARGQKKIKKKDLKKEKKINIYCRLDKKRKKIALIENKNLSFLQNFKMPSTEIIVSNKNLKKNGWIYLCNYNNNISNVKANINLFYKFTKNKPKNFTWHSIDNTNSEFIPSFTKKIFKKIQKLYK